MFEYAPVSEDGAIELAYVDSGPPLGSEDYTTLVCIHGMSYNSENFKPLMRAAPAHNYRVVALNRRDYRGSTPFAPADYDLLASDPETFLVQRARELARFLVHLVRKGGVREAVFGAGDGGGDGGGGGDGEWRNTAGLVVLGWSAGNSNALGLLAFGSRLDEEVRVALGPYIRGIVMWDPASFTIGLSSPATGYSPSFDPDIPANQRSLAFGIWVSSHFHHPDPSYPPTRSQPQPQPGPAPTPQPTPQSAFNLADLSVKDPIKSREPTIDLIPLPELQRTFDALPSGTQGSDLRIMRGSPEAVRWGVTQKALFRFSPASDGDGDGAGGFVFPRARVGHVYGLESVWSAVWAGWELRRLVERERGRGRGRVVRSVGVPGASHFFHYEEPERAMEIFAEAVA